METKTCSRCLAEKPITRFRLIYHKIGRTRLDHCIECSIKFLNRSSLPMTEKICTICKKLTPKQNFYKNRCNRDGLSCICIQCDESTNKKFHAKNSIQQQEYRRNKKQNDKRKRYETDDKYRAGVPFRKYIKDNTISTHKPCTICRIVFPKSNFYSHKNKPNGSSACKQCRRSSEKKYAKENPQKSRDKANRWANKRIENRLHKRMGFSIWYALRGAKKEISWLKYVDYTITELKNHIESLFTDGMNWEVFKTGDIHIDHITPASWFNYNQPTDPEFKKCWSLENLQPMWGRENCSKNNRYSGQYDPSFNENNCKDK